MGKEKESNFRFESLFDSYELSFEEPTLDVVNHCQCLHCQLSKNETGDSSPLSRLAKNSCFINIYTIKHG